ncbi:putative signal transducing protein [Croceimicrobium sp.]|uniref:putative signal transducing protein n=1 Tax=Croceimicrobium sp. TaxID=2828340 RepID=UPI003BAB384F
MGKLVSIAEFNGVNEAYVLKSRLESEGIACFLTNENLNSVLAGIGFTKVVLQVPLEDSIRALDILYENPIGSPINL